MSYNVRLLFYYVVDMKSVIVNLVYCNVVSKLNLVCSLYEMISCNPSKATTILTIMLVHF